MLRAALLCLALSACAGRPGTLPAPSTWIPVAELEGRLPPSVRVFELEAGEHPLRAWHVRVDLRSDAVRAEVVLPNDTDGLETPSQMAARTGACVVVNGGFFDVSPAGRGAPRDLLLVDGELRWPAAASGRGGRTRPCQGAALGLGGAARAEVRWVWPQEERLLEVERPSGRTFITRAKGPPPPEARDWAVLDALQSGPALILDGRPCEPPDLRTPRQPRTAAGVTAAGELILLVVDGRQRASVGATFAELTTMLLELGCCDALNLDGGGSSALVVLGERVNVPVGRRVEREVASGVAVHCAPE